MMRRLRQAFKGLLPDEGGQTMLEYIVIVVFVVLAMIIVYKIVMPITASIHRASASILE